MSQHRTDLFVSSESLANSLDALLADVFAVGEVTAADRELALAALRHPVDVVAPRCRRH